MGPLQDKQIQDAMDSRKGAKFDEGKKDWSLLPLCLIEPLVTLMEGGAAKGYGKHSCLGSYDNADGRFMSAQLRHLVACEHDPLAIDEETGGYHQAAVAFNALMRLYHADRMPE